MNPKTHDGPGLSIPPPIIYMTALFIGIGFNYVWPTSLLPGPWRYIAGMVIVAIAGVVITPVLTRFRRAGTPFDVRKPASALITDGPYRFSRHPSYVALTLLYTGVTLLLNNGWALILVVPLLLVMDQWVVRKEERHLEVKFGEEYRRYKSAVRRWL